MSIAPTYRYKFNNTMTDTSGNSGPTLTKGSAATLSSTDLTIDRNDANSYFNSPASTFYDLGSVDPYTIAFWITRGPNFDTGSQDSFGIGSGTVNNLGNTTMYITQVNTSATFRFSIVNSSNQQSQVLVNSSSMTAGVRYLLMISYNPATDGTSGITIAFAPEGSIQSAVQITSASNAHLQKLNSSHVLISRPVLTSTGGESYIIDDMQIYTGAGMYFDITNYMDIMNAGPDGTLGSFPVSQNSPTLAWDTYGTQVSQNSPTLAWDTFALISKNSPLLEWDVFGQVNKNSPLLEWGTYGQATTNSPTLSWDVAGRLVKNSPVLEWDTYQSVSQDSVLLTWNTYQAVAQNSPLLEWNVFGQISKNSPLLEWELGGSVSKNSPHLAWSAGGSAFKTSPHLAWLINGAFDMAFGLEAYKFSRFRVPNNVNYEMFRNISITNSSGASFPKGTTLEFTLDTASMFTVADIDEFCENFRLTWVSSLRAEMELDLDILLPNTSSTTFRFKLQAPLANGSTVSTYRLYYRVKNQNLFEETFRGLKGVYYFHARQLSSNLAQTGATWSNTVEGIKRDSSGSPAKLGFNVPDDADVEIDFRFLDVGATDQSRYIGLEWRGDNASTRTYRLDNYLDTGADNRIDSSFSGSSWSVLGSPVTGVKTTQATMRAEVIGSTVNLYLNGTLLDTVTDATAPTGGMQIVLPNDSSAIITAIRVKQGIGAYTPSISSGLNNLVQVTSSAKIRLDDTKSQNIQSTVIRLKRQPDNSFIMEDIRTIGEAGDSYDATVDQTDSIELHLATILNSTLVTARRLDT